MKFTRMLATSLLLIFGFISTLSMVGCHKSSSSTTTTTSYSVGGTLSGLSGTVVLQNNSGDDLSLTATGSFTFATKLADSATYSVSVKTQPSGQTCTVSTRSGTISAANVSTVVVSCVASSSTGAATASTSSCDVTAGALNTSTGVYAYTGTYKYTIGKYTFCQDYPVYNWNTNHTGLSGITDVTISIGSITAYDSTHYYVPVYVSTANVSWIQAAYLANSLGGYLAMPKSAAQNTAIYNLISAGSTTSCQPTYSTSGSTKTLTGYVNQAYCDDDTYFWHFPSSQTEHDLVAIGPFLGGFQPDSAVTSVSLFSQAKYGWMWLDGTQMTDSTGTTVTYANWATDLYCDATYSTSCSSSYTDSTNIDYDFRNNVQPNASGDGQPFMGFGEMNQPVATWGDYTSTVGERGTTANGGSSYGFVMEFPTNPSGKW